MYALILLAFLDGGPSFLRENKATPREEVIDRLELNHVYDGAGDIKLDQYIFWDYSPSMSLYVVRDWKTVKEEKPYKSGKFYVLFFKDRDGIVRKIFAKSFVETWTDYDPESVNQETVPRDNRKGFR